MRVMVNSYEDNEYDNDDGDGDADDAYGDSYDDGAPIWLQIWNEIDCNKLLCNITPHKEGGYLGMQIFRLQQNSFDWASPLMAGPYWTRKEIKYFSGQKNQERLIKNVSHTNKN